LFLLIPVTAATGDGGPSPGARDGYPGVLGADGVRYVTSYLEGSSTVQARRGDRVLRSRIFRGYYGIPLVAYDGSTGGLSGDGRTLVLTTLSRSFSRFPVLDARTLALRRVVTLRGSYAFDALSPDGSTMYVIQYTSTIDYTQYRVRAVDLHSGHVLPGAIVDKREPDEKMQGAPMSRVATRDGGWAYTLYSRQAQTAFVHALDTRHRAAVCIDLPFRVDISSRVRISLVGTQLVVRQTAIGTLAVIDTRTYRVTPVRKAVAPGTPIR
jgi:hypothetical protein